MDESCFKTLVSICDYPSVDEQEALFLSVSSKNKLELWSDETNFVRIDNKKRVPLLSVIWCIIAIVLFCDDEERDMDHMVWQMARCELDI